jgi:hypothetical protein
MADDAVNINGDYHLVMATEGRELRVLAKHGMNIEPGDSAAMAKSCASCLFPAMRSSRIEERDGCGRVSGKENAVRNEILPGLWARDGVAQGVGGLLGGGEDFHLFNSCCSTSLATTRAISREAPSQWSSRKN